jgi:hypothetical protein
VRSLPGAEAELAIGEIDVGAAKRAQVRDELISPRRDRRTDLYGIWTAEGDVL